MPNADVYKFIHNEMCLHVNSIIIISMIDYRQLLFLDQKDNQQSYIYIREVCVKIVHDLVGQ